MHLRAILAALGLTFGWAAGHDETTLFRDRSVSIGLFSDLEELSRLCDISYCTSMFTGGVSEPFNCWSRCSEFSHLELVKDWRTGFSTHSDSGGYLALDHGRHRILVAFRGTINLAGMVADFRLSPHEYTPFPGSEDQATGKTVVGRRDSHVEHVARCSDCTIHAGFARVWNNTRIHIIDAVAKQVAQYPEYELHLVGHSLGAAVAAFAALDFNARQWQPWITTFGEPRIGNAATNKHIDSVFRLNEDPDANVSRDQNTFRWRRVTRVNDPIPLLPPTEWGFGMHAGEIYITKPSLSPSADDLKHCKGAFDKKGIAGEDPSYPEKLETAMLESKGIWGALKESVPKLFASMVRWDLSHRYRFWEVLIAHRDYFWRLGLCVPGGDPTGGGGHFPELAEWRLEHGIKNSSGPKADASQEINKRMESETKMDAQKEL